jgi:septal ring factor EnvC (AmiA/AmiB activator)
MKWTRYALLVFALLLPGLAWAQDGSSEREEVLAALQTQIDELQSIEQNLMQSDAELTSLREQTESLKAEIESSKIISKEQAERLQVLAKQLADLKESKEVQLKNFAGLLELCGKLKTEYKTSQTLNYALGGTAAGLLITLVITLLMK